MNDPMNPSSLLGITAPAGASALVRRLRPDAASFQSELTAASPPSPPARQSPERTRETSSPTTDTKSANKSTDPRKDRARSTSERAEPTTQAPAAEPEAISRIETDDAADLVVTEPAAEAGPEASVEAEEGDEVLVDPSQVAAVAIPLPVAPAAQQASVTVSQEIDPTSIEGATSVATAPPESPALPQPLPEVDASPAEGSTEGVGQSALTTPSRVDDSEGLAQPAETTIAAATVDLATDGADELVETQSDSPVEKGSSTGEANEDARSAAEAEFAPDDQAAAKSDLADAELAPASGHQAVDQSGSQENGAAPSSGPASTDNAASGPPAMTDRAAPRADATQGSRGTSTTPVIDPARFVSRVSRAFEAASDRGGGPLRLRLSPPELGSLEIRLEVKDGAMTATVEADTQAARSALLDNLPALRDRLAEQQVRVERFDVNVRDDSQGGATPQGDTQQRDSWGEPRGRARNPAPSAPASPTVSRPTIHPRFADGRINVVA